jgi:hydrogenase nickel incorporation protein HypB
MDAAKERVVKLNPGIKIIEVSCKTGQGIEEWTRWLEKEIKTYRKATAP